MDYKYVYYLLLLLLFSSDKRLYTSWKDAQQMKEKAKELYFISLRDRRYCLVMISIWTLESTLLKPQELPMSHVQVCRGSVEWQDDRHHQLIVWVLTCHTDPSRNIIKLEDLHPKFKIILPKCFLCKYEQQQINKYMTWKNFFINTFDITLNTGNCYNNVYIYNVLPLPKKHTIRITYNI